MWRTLKQSPRRRKKPRPTGRSNKKDSGREVTRDIPAGTVPAPSSDAPTRSGHLTREKDRKEEGLIPADHVELLRQANAGYYPEKDYFYRFKDRFLRQHGRADGWDRQIITKLCHRCGGKGYWTQCTICGYYGPCDLCWHTVPLEKHVCGRCDDGIYARNIYYLERFILGDTVFHIPARIPENDPPVPLFVSTITGNIAHAHVDEHEARPAAFRLFKIYDREILRDMEEKEKVFVCVD
jgi:hypothetical protein